MSTRTVTHRPAESRFVVTQDEEVVGYLSYETVGGTADLQHTVVDAAHRQHGLGGALVEEALRTFRADRMKVRPTCPFVADFITEHPEYQDLLEPSLVPEDTGDPDDRS
jgi:predicted GNAT family acetyltransferase